MTYTYLEDVPIVICDDCGASAFSEERVVHYATCKPGECAKWTKYYEQALNDEALDKEYKKHEVNND